MQNPNNVKSSIELKSNSDVEALSKSMIIKTIVTVNAIVLCASPLKLSNSIDLLNKKMAIESRSNINIYPTKHIRCENGKVIPETEKFEDGNTSVTIGISNTEPTVNIKFQQIINDLEEENAMLKRRLEKSLPVHAISYIALNSVLLTLSVTLLILRFAYGVYTVDPYYLICMLIISITLLGTAVVSLKDWKKFLNETKRTR